ncbi:MarR family winged helix-turn-helix transcriptional regulator [Myxacorys almedinensis]|uniref:MarR family transcriptional regulator n=1 Tax=Myxacorys almedinensis A TaxID=2690445 RepID=A0A8J8CII7_9CYAN|nr:MarR family transcriptional regulator [Myxacorys almedinensis]NDJ17868.1 MarR family transcriptional regulator [Myxacorys almedinensis A]
MPKKANLTSEKPKSDPHNLDPQLDAQSAACQPFMPALRELAMTYQAFCSYDEPHIRELGLTPPQFDVLCTLGNTAGMFMNQLAEKTLVTKGTLTGIVDRLEQKGLVRREVPPENRRCFLIVLTPDGDRVFRDVFPAHISYLKQRFDRLGSAELEQIYSALHRLRQIFD